jgi:cell division protein FtsL
LTPRTAAAPRHRPASHAGRGLRRGPAPRAARRVSGPAQPAFAGAPSAAAPRPFAVRLGATAMRVGDARFLDRLVRGRAWIAIIAVALLGIVFMQVSLLKLNAGISRAVTAADTLDRQNSTLRGDISNLDSGERIQAVAAKLGMITPAAGDVHYLDGREANGARAAASIKPPNPVTTPAAAAAAVGQQQPAAAATTATQQPTAATQQQPAAATATAAQQQQPTAQQQATTQPQQQTPIQSSTGAAAGGANSSPPVPTTASPAATTSSPVTAAGGATAPQGG